MKRFILSMTMLLTVALSTMAMSYEQARERALFLTDKMAYELNLNDEQYEAAYEVNLDYLMSINTYDDLYGTYWTRRNLDLSYILFDWQYNAFCSAAYFYRPLVWTNGVWRFSIYARYPHRTYFYFGRPTFYATYCGGHSWRMNGGRSWYNGRTFGPRPGESRFGMRDRFDRGDYRGTRNHGSYNRNDGRADRNNGNFNNRRPNKNNSNSGDRKFDRNNSGYSNGRNNSNDNYNGRNDNQNNKWNRRDNGTTSGNRNNTTIKNVDLGSKNDRIIRQSSTRESVNRTMQMSREKMNIEPSRSTTTRTSSMQNSRPASTFSPSRSSGNSGFNSSRSMNTNSTRSMNSNSGGRSNGGGHFGGRR